MVNNLNSGVLFSAILCWTLTIIMNNKFECQMISMAVTLLWFLMFLMDIAHKAVMKEQAQHDIIKQANDIIHSK